MCGICGQFNFETPEPVDIEKIKKMAQSLIHRGPDDEGYYFKDNIGLGFRRLSIIDLQGGHQPMTDDDKSVYVVFNGEIYNFIELKKELESYGYVFRTQSDTEVIVHGYKKWGKDVLTHLNGMFGLAIWDETIKRLIVARDRMGIKLVYYKIQSGQVSFASEIRALLAVDSNKPEIDTIAMNLFLRYRYTPSPYTILNGVKKLAPGTRVIFENGKYNIERWWDFKPVPFDPVPTVAEAQEQLINLYKSAVKRHLISDVPLGVLLSGGLDSGLLLSLIMETNDSCDTYTVGFGESFKDDEINTAAYTAGVLNCPHHTIHLDKGTFDSSLSHIINVLEEPIASSSIVPMYHLCKRASEDMKVVLMGQGPDELFGGYKRHLGIKYGFLWRRLPLYLRKSIGGLLQTLPRNETIKRALYSLDISPRMKRYQQVFSIMPEPAVNELFIDGIIPSNVGDYILDCWSDYSHLMEHTDELGGFQFLEIRSSLPDELLMYADKLSMAHSLEIRVPYLDQQIVEYVERLPSSYKINRFSRKWLHRNVSNQYLPKKITKRKKLGFQTPVDEWFRDSLSQQINESLLNNKSLLYNYLKSSTVKKLVEDHRLGKNDYSKIIFSLVVLEKTLHYYLN